MYDGEQHDVLWDGRVVHNHLGTAHWSVSYCTHLLLLSPDMSLYLDGYFFYTGYVYSVFVFFKDTDYFDNTKGRR